MVVEALRAVASDSRPPSDLHRVEQAIALDHLLHGERRGACDRVAEVRVAVLEEAAAAVERLDDPLLDQHRADRLVAAAQPFGDA